MRCAAPTTLPFSFHIPCAGTSVAPVTPAGKAVTQEKLNKIRALLHLFKTQLDAIGTPIAPAGTR